MPTLGELLSAPPVGGANPFIFTDESGVVKNEPSQPFYGIGMLKIADAGRWADATNRILDRHVSGVELRAEKERQRRLARGEVLPPKIQLPRSAYELKFAEIKSSTRPQYDELIDFYTTQADGYFCALIIDKRAKGVDPIAACGSPWDALIKYSITLLRTNIGARERAIIVSDNYQKPKGHPQFFERELVAGLGARAANAVMMDSAASPLLQLVDVLLGCVMYHYKCPLIVPAPNAHKKAVADRLAAAYGVPSLARGFTRSSPNYLSVWPFVPRKPAP